MAFFLLISICPNEVLRIFVLTCGLTFKEFVAKYFILGNILPQMRRFERGANCGFACCKLEKLREERTDHYVLSLELIRHIRKKIEEDTALQTLDVIDDQESVKIATKTFGS